jgi:phytoene dehydrogenase-like protein
MAISPFLSHLSLLFLHWPKFYQPAMICVMLIKRREKIEKNYDIIVIGSGLAGMTAANKLAKDGRKVLLLEAHNKLGGFATWFYREQKKHVFDVSLHGFPIGMKKTCRKYWNKKIADCIVQVKDVRFHNPQFKVQTDFTRENYTHHLVKHFKIPFEEVNAFFEFITKMNFYDDQTMTNKELFEKFFPNRSDVVRFLLEPISYANGSTLEDPAISYGIVFSNFMSKGVYTFQGGTDFLISLMREELLNNGVDIKMNAKVEKILIDQKKAHGVKIENQEVYSKVVLSNANIKTTIKELCGEEHFSSEFFHQSESVKLNTSSSQVYIALKDGVKIPHIGDLIFTSTAKTFNTSELLDINITSRTFSVYYPEIRPQDEVPRFSIVSSTNSKYEDWKNLSEQEYAQEKAKMITETIECLETFLPDIKEKIDFVDAATPLTVARYTLHPEGTSFGTKFEGLTPSMGLNEQIEGLFHAGSVGIIMSGWLGAANYGVIQSNKIQSYLFSNEEL